MKMKYILVLLCAGVTLTGCANLTEVGQLGNVKIHRVTARGVFSPSSTTLIASPASGAKSPEDLQVLSASHGPGFVPAVATAGGVVGGAALLRPSKTENTSSTSINTSVSSTGGNGGAGGAGGNGTGGGQFVPPGHVNNPSANN